LKLRACLRDAIKQDIRETKPPKGVTYGDVESGALNVQRLGDGSAGARVSFGLSSQGLSFDAIYDVVIVRVGRGLSWRRSTASRGFRPHCRGDF
jgi:hypothetical protein